MAFQFAKVIWGSFYFILFTFTLSSSLTGKKLNFKVAKISLFLLLQILYVEFAVQFATVDTYS